MLLMLALAHAEDKDMVRASSGSCSVYVGEGERYEAGEHRVALVVGNSGYFAPGAQLTDPTSDAALMADTLWQLGFTVSHCSDLDQKSLAGAVRDFGNEIPEGGVALFYYSGHGIQFQDSNWLVPIDAYIQEPDDVELEAVNLSALLRKMNGSDSKVNIVLLDACRNNPFGTTGKGVGGNRNGLADVQSVNIGTIIGFATAPGTVALEGEGDNSPWTEALTAEMLEPGQRIEDVFMNTRTRVIDETDERQVPWENGSLTQPFSFMEAAIPGTLRIGSDIAGEVFVGDESWGEINAGGTLERSVPPGEYEVRVGREKRQATVVEDGFAEVGFRVAVPTGERGTVPTAAWGMVAGGAALGLGGGVCAAVTWSMAQEGVDTVEEGQQLKNANLACGGVAVVGGVAAVSGTGWALKSLSVAPIPAGLLVSGRF
jgi:hypothetical protein